MTPSLVLDFERPIVALERRIASLTERSEEGRDLAAEIERLERKAEALRSKVFRRLSPWQHVQLARHPARPRPHGLVRTLVKDFVELSGDRITGDDPGVLAGLGVFERRAVAVLAHGRDRPAGGGRRWTGPPDAAGLRKAGRLVDLAHRFGLPVLSLVDVGDDERRSGLRMARTAEPLAEQLAALAALNPPGITIITGEAYGAAALSLMPLDRVLMLEFAVCAPVPPERCAMREHGDISRAEKLAKSLRLTASDLKALGLCDEIIEEPPGGAHRSADRTVLRITRALRRHLRALDDEEPEARRAARQERLAGLGQLVALQK